MPLRGLDLSACLHRLIRNWHRGFVWMNDFQPATDLLPGPVLLQFQGDVFVGPRIIVRRNHVRLRLTTTTLGPARNPLGLAMYFPSSGEFRGSSGAIVGRLNPVSAGIFLKLAPENRIASIEARYVR